MSWKDLVASWNIPVNQQKCAALNHTLHCDFGTFTNATNLPDPQKLRPNNDVTGFLIANAFMGSAITALILTVLLIVDKFILHFFAHKKGKDAISKKKHYLRAVHLLESMLHALSDQQLVACISLLLALNHQSCNISAYHFNLVCEMLILGAAIHICTLISIPDFFYRGKSVATYRVIAIGFQFVYSGMTLSARNTGYFPTTASSLAILPAACFENMNASNLYGFSDAADFAQNITATNTTNATQFFNNFEAAATKTGGFAQYLTLASFLIFAILLWIIEWFEITVAGWFGAQTPPRWMRLISSGINTVILIVVMIFTGLTVIAFNTLRVNMEVPQWYLAGNQTSGTYANIVSFLLFGSGSITLVKAFRESLPGVRGRRFEEFAKALKDGEDAANMDLGKNGNYAIPLIRI